MLKPSIAQDKIVFLKTAGGYGVMIGLVLRPTSLLKTSPQRHYLITRVLPIARDTQ